MRLFRCTSSASCCAKCMPTLCFCKKCAMRITAIANALPIGQQRGKWSFWLMPFGKIFHTAKTRFTLPGTMAMRCCPSFRLGTRLTKIFQHTALKSAVCYTCLLYTSSKARLFLLSAFASDASALSQVSSLPTRFSGRVESFTSTSVKPKSP